MSGILKAAVAKRSYLTVAASLVATYAVVAVLSWELKNRELELHPADPERQFHLRVGVLAALAGALAWWADKRGKMPLLALCSGVAAILFALAIVYPTAVLIPGMLLDVNFRARVWGEDPF